METGRVKDQQKIALRRIAEKSQQPSLFSRTTGDISCTNITAADFTDFHAKASSDEHPSRN